MGYHRLYGNILHKFSQHDTQVPSQDTQFFVGWVLITCSGHGRLVMSRSGRCVVFRSPKHRSTVGIFKGIQTLIKRYLMFVFFFFVCVFSVDYLCLDDSR